MEHILCPLFERAIHSPCQRALITDHNVYTYAELDRKVQTLCHALEQRGIEKLQRVAFIAKTDLQTICLFFALFRLGAIACPLSHRTPPVQQAKDLEYLKASHFLDPQTLPLHPSTFFKEPTIALEAPATLLLTSGSSGVPKAVCHTFANHYYNALGAVEKLALESTSRWLLALPLFHVSGLSILIRSVLTGASIALSQMPLLQATTHLQITHLSLVPTQLHRLLEEQPYSFTSLRCLLLGGAPLSSKLLGRSLSRGLPVVTTYGMTEMSSMITFWGTVLPFRELKIEKDGEIWVRGKTLFKGYWDPVLKEIAPQGKDTWFPTKDLGRMTPDGKLKVIGRKDRQFISGGENIQPEEIEMALCSLPGIRQASVLPIDHEEFGQRPVAFIDDVTRGHTLESVQKKLREILPAFKLPVALFPYPENTGLKPSLSTLKDHLKARFF